MTRHFHYYLSASEGDNQSVRSSAPVVSRCFPGGYNVKLYISRGRLAWWLLAFLHSVCLHKNQKTTKSEHTHTEEWTASLLCYSHSVFAHMEKTQKWVTGFTSLYNDLMMNFLTCWQSMVNKTHHY